ncbi:MAG: DUF1611 domain-containing protein [Kordiimonas sp.]
MSDRTVIGLEAPYLIFIGDIDSKLYAKTGQSIVDWRPELVKGQLAFGDNKLDLGVPQMSVSDAIATGVKSLIIGVAPVGGKIGDAWIKVLVEAASAGLNIVSGLHFRLTDFPELRDAASMSGATLVDVRVPPKVLPIGNGKKRKGKRLLMVGTDCAVGKKYTALAMTKCLSERGEDATFRATGQTGIMIAGEGIPVDSVIADFVSGAAEQLSPENNENHWDVIEGQGSLFNASYAGVSLSLLHGSQPDGIIVCHDPSRDTVSSCPEANMPTVAECIELNLSCARLTNPQVRCLGVSVNTSAMRKGLREAYLSDLSAELGIPCVDPLVEGCGAIYEQMQVLGLVGGNSCA